MITLIRNWLHQRALKQAEQACREIGYASIAALFKGDIDAARYFDAELKLAKNKLAAIKGHPNPGRYCCDHRCERQGRANCACDSLPRVSHP